MRLDSAPNALATPADSFTKMAHLQGKWKKDKIATVASNSVNSGRLAIRVCGLPGAYRL
jgi:hypothetical protein